MYCDNCGYKLKKTDTVCPKCGNTVENAEYCGGFWGLVGEEIPETVKNKAPAQPVKVIREEVPVPVEKTSTKPEETRDAFQSIRNLITTGLIVILLIMNLVNFMRISNLKNNNQALSDRLSSIEQDADPGMPEEEASDNTAETQGDISGRLENLESTIHDMSQKIDVLNTDNRNNRKNNLQEEIKELQGDLDKIEEEINSLRLSINSH